MAGRDPQAFVRRAWPWLLAVFGAFLLFGLWRGNWSAVLGGAAGLGWVLWQLRR